MVELTASTKKEIETDTYKTFDVLGLCGLHLKRSTFDQWVARGFITPTKESRGSGYPAEYSFNDLAAIVIFKELRESGIKNKLASELAKISSRYDCPVYIDLHKMQVVEEFIKYGFFIDVEKIKYELADSMLP